MISLQFIESALTVWRQKYSVSNIRKQVYKGTKWSRRKEYGQVCSESQVTKEKWKLECTGFKEKTTKSVNQENVNIFFVALLEKLATDTLQITF